MPNTPKGASAPAIFNFNAHAVRILDKDGELWFVASDVACALEYRNAPDMTRSLDADEADTHILRIRSENGIEQDREVTIISESGLYSAILRSRKPEAKRFKKWVTSEVLPAIRKTGSYSTSTRRRKASREAAVWLSETEAFNLAGLLGMLPCFEEVQQKAENVLRAAESPLASTMFDAWHEIALFCGVLDHVRERCKKVQARMNATILR